MAVVTQPIVNAGGLTNRATGKFTGTGSGTATVPVGFTPRKIKVIDTSNGNSWEWQAGMGSSMLATVASTGVQTLTASLVTTDYADESITTTGVYAPGTSGPGEGTLIDTSVTVENDASPKTGNVIFAVGVNVSAHVLAYAIED